MYWTGHIALMVALYTTLITLPGTASFVYAQYVGDGSVIPQSSQGKANITLLSQRYNDGTLVGELMNNGSSVAESVKVTASFYDADSKIVAAKLTYADPSTMRPGERATFNIYTSDEAIEQDAETYEFVLQWRDEDGVQGSRRVIAEEGSEHEPKESLHVTITILSGASVQGNPDYDPDVAQVPLNTKVVWQNTDSVPHTATSGSGPADANSGQIFDTGIINNGESSAPMELAGAAEGDQIAYYCQVHPYMTSFLTVSAASAEGYAAAPAASGGAQAAGATLTIPEGASVQGNPSYDPDPLTVTPGDVVEVSNQDTVPHTVTSGSGPADLESGSQFDTNIIDAQATAQVDTANLAAGDYPYYCKVHPYMVGTMKVS